MKKTTLFISHSKKGPKTRHFTWFAVAREKERKKVSEIAVKLP